MVQYIIYIYVRHKKNEVYSPSVAYLINILIVPRTYGELNRKCVKEITRTYKRKKNGYFLLLRDLQYFYNITEQ